MRRWRAAGGGAGQSSPVLQAAGVSTAMVEPVKTGTVAASAPASAEYSGPPGPERGGERALPLYLTIASALQREIAEGTYPVCAMLPTETELCFRFGVSRYTVREALRRLGELGLVKRKAGAGTVVMAAHPPTTFVHRIGAMDELLAYPDTTYRQLISTGTIVADEHIGELIECAPGSEWFLMRCTRKHHDCEAPIGIGEFYILPQIGAAINWPQIDHITVGERIEMHGSHQVHSTRLKIFASTIRGDLTEILKVGDGTPGMSMVRRYFDARGENFASTVTVHPEHRFVYTMELKRDE